MGNDNVHGSILKHLSVVFLKQIVDMALSVLDINVNSHTGNTKQRKSHGSFGQQIQN